MSAEHDPSESLSLFGRIAVTAKLVSVDQVLTCLRLQEQGDERRLGELLVELGYMRPVDVIRIIRLQLEMRSEES